MNENTNEKVAEAVADDSYVGNPHLQGSFGLGVLRGLQRKRVIYAGHIYDPAKPAKRRQQKASRKANR